MPKPLDPDERHRAFIGIHVPRALRERLDREAATARLTLRSLCGSGWRRPPMRQRPLSSLLSARAKPRMYTMNRGVAPDMNPEPLRNRE